MIRKQLQQNSIAYLGLVIAIASLFYVSWRHERTEYNQNIRWASFEILRELGELQTIMHFAHYEKDRQVGHPIRGWGHVLLLKDLATVMPGTIPYESERLLKIWQQNWEGLGTDTQSARRIRHAIENMRKAVVNELQSLD